MYSLNPACLQFFLLLLSLSRNVIVSNILADAVLHQRAGSDSHCRHEVVADAVSVCVPLCCLEIVLICDALSRRHEPELCDVVRAYEMAAQPLPAVVVRPALTIADVSPTVESHATPTTATAHNSKTVEMTGAKNTALKSDKNTESKMERRESFGAELPGSITPASSAPVEKL
jgi:hypothetical protein